MAVISEVITDKVIISFDTLSPPTVENISGENYFRIKGTIENFQDLVDAHGNLEGFYTYSFENHVDDYSIILDSKELVNGAVSNENFDFTIKIPDYFPNGNYDSSWAEVNFTNASQLPVEFPSQMPDLIYNGRTGSDSQDPILTIDSVTSGNNDYPSLIVSGTAFDSGVKSNQFQVNGIQVTGDQASPEIAKFPDGHFVVTWRNDPSDTSPGGVGGDTRIFAQILDPSGKRVGNEFQVNTYEGIQERNAVVETLGNDKFVVIWHSTGRDSEVDEDIRGQILDRSGNKLGVEFTLNSTTSNSQNFPDITSDVDGGFIAAWNSMYQDSSGGSIIARKFDASGDSLTDELLINTYTSGEQTNPEINQLSDGNVVISWMSSGQDGSGVGLYGQIIDQNFQKIGNEFSINTQTNGDQAYHSMASLTNGGFVVVWEDSGPTLREDHTLKGQLFDSDGSKNGSEFKVNSAQNEYGFIYDSEFDPNVVGLKDGGFFVTYSGHDNGHGGYGYDVFGQFFDDTGTKIGPEFSVNDLTVEHQNTSSVVEVDGGVLVTFHNYNTQSFIRDENSYSDTSGHGIAGKFIPNPNQFSDLTGNPVIQDIRVNSAYEGQTRLEFIFDRAVSVEYKNQPIGNVDVDSQSNDNPFRDDLRLGHFGANSESQGGGYGFGDKAIYGHGQMTQGGTVLSFEIFPNLPTNYQWPEQHHFFLDDAADPNNLIGSEFNVIDLNGNSISLRELILSDPKHSDIFYSSDNAVTSNPQPGIRIDDGADGEIYPTSMGPNNIDYVLFNFSDVDGQASQSIAISKDMINEDGSFSFEYITDSWNWNNGTGEVDLRGAIAIDAAGNETLYANSNFTSDPNFRIYERNEPQYWDVLYFKEDNSSHYDYEINLDKGDLGTHGSADVIELDSTPGSYANFSNDDQTHNGQVIPAKTILNTDGTTFSIPSEFFDNNQYDHDVEIRGTYGNDYVNVSDSDQDIAFEWSAGNDVYFASLKDKDYQNAEFVTGWNHRNIIEHLDVTNPTGMTFDNSDGPALIVTSEYGTSMAYNISEIETTLYDDIVIGKDNFYENIRLFQGEDIITSGYGDDDIRTKPKDVDANSTFKITDMSSYDKIKIQEIKDLDINNYWDQFSVSYSGGNTHIGMDSEGINNQNIFEIIGEKSLNHLKVEERNGETSLEFYFNDDMQGNNLKRENSEWYKENRHEVYNDETSIYISNYKPGTPIKINDAIDRFDFSVGENFLSEVSISYDVLNNLTKLSIDDGDIQQTNFIVVEGNYGIQLHGFSSDLEDFFISFGSGQTQGTNEDDDWFGSSFTANVYNGLDGDDYIIGGTKDDQLSGGDGDDRIYSWIGDNILDGGNGYDILYYSASKFGVHIDISNETVKYITDGIEDYPSNYAEYLNLIDFSDVTTFSNFEEYEGSDNDYVGDVIDGRASDSSVKIKGFSGDDLIYGSDHADKLHDGDGNDTVYGMGGNDTFVQGSGGDTFDGGEGNDTLTSNWSSSLPDFWSDNSFIEANLAQGFAGLAGSSQQDVLRSIENYIQTGTNGASYHVTGTDQNNILTTSNGDDTLIGGSGNDILSAGEGDDTLYAGDGDDKLYGESGNDLFVVNGSGNQMFDGGEGIDTFKLDISHYVPDMPNPSNFVYMADLNTGFTGSKNFPDIDNDILVNIENIDYTGLYNTEFIGDDKNNYLKSGSGNDLITGGLGNDIIDGGKGNDIFVQEGNSDQWTIKYNQSIESLNSTPQTITYTVMVGPKPDGSGDNGFYLNGLTYPAITFEEGNTYIFDVSSPTMLNNNLRFSESADGIHINNGTEYTDGVTITGNPGSPGATIEITIGENTPDLFYYSENNSGMGSTAAIDPIDYGNFIISNANEYNIVKNIEFVQFDDQTISLEIDPQGLVDGIFKNTTGSDNFNGTFWEEYVDLSSGETNQGGITLLGNGTYLDGHGNTDNFNSVEAFGGTSDNDTLIGTNTDETIPQSHNALNLDHKNYEGFKPGAGDDFVDGKGGYDEINYGDSPNGMTIDISQTSINDGWGNTDTIINIEGVEGTIYDDTIVGNSGNNSLDGKFGNDTINGGDGFDYAEYNGTTRTNLNISLETGIATFAKTSDTSQTYTHNISNIEGVIGTNNDDIIRGDEDSNILEGVAGNDEIYGGGGNDVLVTGHGDDKLYGEEGNDILISVGSGTQEYDGGEGVDTLIYNTSYTTSLDPDYINRVEIDLSAGQAGQEGNPNLTDTINNIENVTYEGLFDVLITGDGNDNILTGGLGNDYITGKGGNDTLEGNDGNDVFVLGGYGETTIDGGSGIDTFKVGLQNLDYPRNDGENNQSISLNGSSHLRVSDYTNSPLDLSGSHTLEAWVNPDNLNAEFSTIFSKVFSHPSENWAYGIYKMGSDDVISLASNPTGINVSEWWATQQNTGIPSSSLLDDQWHHLAYVVDTDDGENGTIKSYLDGQLFASSELPSSYSDLRQNDFDLVIGGQATGETSANRFWSGDLDEIRIWDNARSSDEIAQSYNEILSGDENGLAFYLNFDGTSPFTDKVNSLAANSNGEVILGSGAPVSTLTNFVYKVNLAEETAGNDTLINIENVDYSGVYNSEIIGDDKANELHGGSGDDIIRGGLENDALYGGGGNDFLYGEAGDDHLHHDGSGHTVFDGGEGVDTVHQDLSNWTIASDPTIVTNLKTGFNGANTSVNDPRYDQFVSIENYELIGSYDSIITGSDVANIISTGKGNDIIHGEDGNDILKSGAGNDEVYGGLGDDLIVQNGSGTQHYDGGEGVDTYSIDYNAFPNLTIPVKVDFMNNFSGLKDYPTNELNDTLVNFENIDLSSFKVDVELIGNNQNNIIESGLGNDIVDGKGGVDTFVQIGDSSSWNLSYNNDGSITIGNGTESNILKNIEFVRFNNEEISTIQPSPNAPELISTSWGEKGIEILKDFDINSPIGTFQVKDIDGNNLNYSSSNNSLEFVNSDQQSTINLDVTVQWVSSLNSNKYFINGVQQNELKLETGNTYVFDLTAVPTSHPFKLSSTLDGSWNGGSEYLDGVSRDGNTLTVSVQTGTPDLYYYCENHPGMGSSALVETIDQVDIFIKEGSALSQLEDLITDVTTLDLSVTDGSNSIDQNFDLKVYDFIDGYSSVVYTTENGANGYVSGTANGFNILTGNQISANTYNVVDENNYLQLSAADDFLTVNAQNLIVKGGLGNDTIINFHSSNVIKGGLGNDTLVGFGDVSSDLRGNAGDDKLTGSSGNDNLSTGSGYDVISAGKGNDTIIIGSGKNLIFGGEGVDTIRNDVEGFNLDTNFQIWGAKWKDSGFSENTIYAVENVITGSGNDIIGAGDEDNTFQTGYGNDFIIAGAGVDTFIFEDDGTDINVNLFSWANQNTGQGIDKFWLFENVVTHSGNDIIAGTDADNLIKAGLGNDIINFGAGNDTFQFSGNENYSINLFTNNQQDTGEGLDTFISLENVISGSGNDNLSGSNRDNIFDPGYGDDFVNAGAGNDTIKFSGEDAVTVDIGYGWWQNTGYGLDKFWGVENVISSSGNDSIKGNAKVNILEGGSGDDQLWGKDEDDFFVFRNNFGEDVIKDFQSGDNIDLTGILGANFEEVNSIANQKKISIFDGNNEYHGSITFEFYDNVEVDLRDINFLYESAENIALY